ncbi:MAG: hypothetical protein CMF69_09300 [Magnetovibrio sp.]|nr:hypothetical protein [Magnetovibrio sp.]
MNYIKLGCNWGSNTPIYYDWLKSENIILGVSDNKYRVGDRVLIMNGYDTKAIAIVKGPPISVTSSEKKYRNNFEKYQIPFEDWLDIYESIIWINISVPFEYKLQAGIRNIQKEVVKRKIDSLVKDFYKMEDIKEMNDLLDYKKQIILQGPPGTGKTYLAKELAKQLTGEQGELRESECRKLIQFHPSYSYEDFVRGISVKTNENGQVEYITENKLLAKFAENAANNKNANYVLIIDEINRANLPSVLGELIYALEYRGEAVESMYAIDDNNQIMIPPNLYIIGTMNTADRSVGHIDYAIRRRFAFVDVLPDESVIDNVKAKDLFNKVSELFIKLEAGKKQNSEYLISDIDYKDIQLGHSYFLLKNGKEEAQIKELELRLQYEIKPILLEYVKDGILQEDARAFINKLQIV